MAKHLTTRQHLTRDPWVMAVIIVEILAIGFLFFAIPALGLNDDSLAQLLKFAIDLARIVAEHPDS